MSAPFVNLRSVAVVLSVGLAALTLLAGNSRVTVAQTKTASPPSDETQRDKVR